MVIGCFWLPLAAWAEEADLRSYFHIAAPWACQTGITVGDKVCLEVAGLGVEVKDSVGTGDGLLIPWLFLADLCCIERPCVIRSLWNKQQLDVVVGKF